jgi:hypothetical protein
VEADCDDEDGRKGDSAAFQSPVLLRSGLGFLGVKEEECGSTMSLGMSAAANSLSPLSFLFPGFFRQRITVFGRLQDVL